MLAGFDPDAEFFTKSGNTVGHLKEAEPTFFDDRYRSIVSDFFCSSSFNSSGLMVNREVLPIFTLNSPLLGLASIKKQIGTKYVHSQIESVKNNSQTCLILSVKHLPGLISSTGHSSVSISVPTMSEQRNISLMLS